MDTATLISRNKEIPFTYLDEDIIMMNIDNGNYYHFNPVGSKVWEYLETGAQSVDVLAEKLTADFEVDKKTAIRDIIAFVHKTHEQGLLSIS